jgi:hypothetical protein
MALQRTHRPRFLKVRSGSGAGVPVQEHAGSGRSLRSLGSPLNARPLGGTKTHHQLKGEQAMPRSNPRPSALDRLEVFIGRWLTEGETVATAEAPSVRIFASDVYQWGPGGQFIIHPAYGRIGGQEVGGLEVIGYDPGTGHFRTHFFDHAGNVITETLTFRDGTWTWQAMHHRCKGVFTDNGKVLTAHHEESDDGKQWRPLMIVTLRKVE